MSSNDLVIRTRKGVKANYRTDSARDLYATRMGTFVGQPLSAFIASVEGDVPSVPGKGKLKGKPEPVSGWVAFLTGDTGPFQLTSK